MKQTFPLAIFSLQIFCAFPAQARSFDDVFKYLQPADRYCAQQVVSSDQDQGQKQQNQGQTEEEPDCE